MKHDFSIIPELPRCSNALCKENLICNNFKDADLCGCKGGYHFNGKICVGRTLSSSSLLSKESSN